MKDKIPTFLCLGLCIGTEQSASALSHEHSPSIDVSPEDMFIISRTQSMSPGILRAVASQLVGDALLPATYTSGIIIIIHEPERRLAEVIMQNSQWIGRRLVFCFNEAR